jgi:pyrroline-5-carboxylate reductase
MPNVALQIDKSVNLVYASDQVLQKERDKITELFNITGKLLWLEKEEKLDNLTPILGSGPAYFFLLAEVLKRSL